MKINSKHAILDIPGGLARQTTERAVKKFGKRIPVVIAGYITDVWGHYDGISQEFVVEVVEVITDTAEDKPS